MSSGTGIDMPNLPRAARRAVEMTRWQSVTGSEGEAAFSARLLDMLAETDAFREHPSHLFALDTHGAPPRQNVFALVKGTGRRCIVLAGHFDTVSTANYGTLERLATEPALLTEAIIAELSARDRTPAEDKVLEDLASGDFLAGRGLLDMKSGLAAGLEVLDRFAAMDSAPGNILFVATPDEENRSRGMRALRAQLAGIAARFDLDIVGGINLDATSDPGDGVDGRAVYLGSVGKFSPFAFVVGRPTHAGYAFDGISAHLIAAAIMQAVEANGDLSDEARDEISPAPVCLECRDVRHTYEVTTPAHVWMSFNWLTHRRTPSGLLGEFRDIVDTAMQSALSMQTDRARAFFERQGIGRETTVTGEVVTYADLRARVSATGGDAALARVADVETMMAETDDPVATTRTIVGAMIAEARLEGPSVVVGFSTLHYPRVHTDMAGPAGERFARTVMDAAQDAAARHGTTIVAKQFFAGISDMSFFGTTTSAADSAVLAGNTPAAAFVDVGNAGPVFPVVNIGPWGRDYHQKGERLHLPYAFDVLPDILHEVALACLSGER